ncbi:MAG: NAD-binding protein [Anaerolineaceae bacterium]|jgi:trk system potassium uptake protein TrkA|nr:NAD-binding protein [Anaerolineaceae bacterium]MDI9530363.1 NAD-binding protein [Chloroflexota bacterium]NLE92900.1 potassium transporter TrkA [Chloroflexota bacterium]
MKIIIVGCGRVGAGLAKNLSLQGLDVTVIDKNKSAFDALGSSFKGKTVEGIGFDQRVLSKAGIEKADALAAVTASDEANIVAARMARSFYKVPFVAARVYEPQKAKIYRRLGIQTISPVTLGIERLTNILVYPNLNVERTLGAGQVSLVDVEVGQTLSTKRLKDIEIPGEIQLVALTRNGRTSLPNDALVFQNGDILHLSATSSGRNKVNQLSKR